VTDRAQVTRAADGVWCVRLGGRFGPGPSVNVFLLPTSVGPVMIDAGLAGPIPLAAVEAGLEQAGFAVADLQAILLTHTHIDHIGLVGALTQRSGAWVAMHPREADDLARFPREPEAMTAMAHGILAAGGAPPSPRENEAWFDAHRDHELRHALTVGPIAADRELHDGDVLDFGDRRLQVIATPGHSPGHVCFWDPARRQLFSGDLLLPDERSLAWMQPTDRDALHEDLGSAARIADVPAEVVLAGHGRPARTVRCLAQDRHSLIVAFLRTVADVLRERAHATPWQVALGLSGDPKLDGRALAHRAQELGRAMYGLRALEARGLAQRCEGRWRLVDDASAGALS
jgi:glyoxylase-like metal-dependent hydrolase (beta-lactamase superfamily II)